MTTIESLKEKKKFISKTLTGLFICEQLAGQYTVMDVMGIQAFPSGCVRVYLVQG